MPYADAAQQPDDSQDPDQSSDTQDIDIRDACQEVNPTPSHERGFAFRPPEADDEVDEKESACHGIERLENCGHLSRYGRDRINDKRAKNQNRKNKENELKD